MTLCDPKRICPTGRPHGLLLAQNRKITTSQMSVNREINGSTICGMMPEPWEGRVQACSALSFIAMLPDTGFHYVANNMPSFAGLVARSLLCAGPEP